MHSRSRKLNTTKRVKASAQQKNSFVNILNQKFTENSNCYHSVIELTHKQWARMKSNAVILSNIVIDSSQKSEEIITYDNVLYSDMIKKHLKRCKCKSNQKNIHWKRPHLNNLGYILIVTHKDELVPNHSDLVIISGGNMNEKASGYIVLCLCQIRKQTEISQYTWGKREANLLHSSKRNIITGHSTHYGSKGKYYSFGNRANYATVDNSTITQYTTKKYKSIQKSNVAKMDAEYLDKMCCRELQTAVNGISKLIPNISRYIAPTITAAHTLQSKYGDCKLEKMLCSSEGLWQASIGVDASTSELHCENDCTYTLISVPKQEKINNQYSEYNFLFEFKKGETLGLKLDEGVSFFFLVNTFSIVKVLMKTMS